MRNSRFVSSIFFGYLLILEYKLPEKGEPGRPGARGARPFGSDFRGCGAGQECVVNLTKSRDAELCAVWVERGEPRALEPSAGRLHPQSWIVSSESGELPVLEGG